MDDSMKKLYEYTDHVGKCEICREMQKQIDKMILKIQMHITNGDKN